MWRILPTSLALVVAPSAFAVFPNQSEDNQFLSVGRFSGASAVAIAPNWFISAEHVNGTTVLLNGQTYNVVENIVAPLTPNVFGNPPTIAERADLRLLRVAETVPVGQFSSMFFGNATGRIATMVGFGDTGIQTANGYSITSGSSGTRRRAQNVIDGLAVARFDNGPGWLTYYYTLDNPSSSNYLAGEGGIAGGDSGGGWFVFDNGEWKLTGISSAIGRLDGSASLGAFDWGGNGFGVALGRYESWIVQTVPEPFTLSALALAALAARRKRKTKVKA
ncbi:MAG: hypothetical protein MUC92_04445 [Fimbriimonadaceae bacterium]|jgi:hypothetical protein|nr:hypothetical protein [Fimbriimonadaceae bacterium]